MEKALELIKRQNDFEWDVPVADQIEIMNPFEIENGYDNHCRYDVDCTIIPQTKVLVVDIWRVISLIGICPHSIDMFLLLAAPSGEVDLSKWFTAFPNVRWWYIDSDRSYTHKNIDLLSNVNTNIEGIVFFIEFGHKIPELYDQPLGWEMSVFYGKHKNSTGKRMRDGTYVIFIRTRHKESIGC
jgi:hypothetical protein